MGKLEKKLIKLRKRVRSLGNAIIAYSGGVDSTLLLKIGYDELGKNAVAVTSVSPSYPKSELEQAKKIARFIGARHITTTTTEMKDNNYLRNFADRCYFCKKNLYTKLVEVAKQEGFANILNGTNLDDRFDYRPGMKAADEFNVIAPLKDAGMTKNDIIAASRALGLPNWDKPASPCLASRIPYGTEITKEKLGMIEKAENTIKNICKDTRLRHLRVRHYGKEARIEVLKENFKHILGNLEKIRTELMATGFENVTLDLEGFKSGKMNKGLKGGKIGGRGWKGRNSGLRKRGTQ